MPGPNEKLSPGERVMSYGKYTYRKYKNVPEDYLKWIVANAFKGQTRKRGKMAARVRWAKEELNRRELLIK